MKKAFWHFLVFALFSFSVQAQVSKPGVPPSFSWPETRQHISFEVMPPIDIVKLQAEDLIFDTIKDVPWRFGEHIFVDMGLKNSGSWVVEENEDRVWRLGIKSPGAYALTLVFDRYVLPPGAELYIYNTDRSRVIGAFTDYNNQDDFYFATTLIEGDELVIEYFEPHWVAFPGELKIESVNHAYRDPLSWVKAFGGSGSCNLNVACPEAEGWEDQIRSVALMLTNGISWCTGALINNTANDGRPFMLTANHCYRNPGTLVFWFNWQSATCSNPPASPPYDAVGGLVDRARYSASDMWLLEFNNPIPEHVGPFFSGWNRSLASVINETIIGIHHPSGDIKKFSYANGGVQSATYLGAPGSGTTHWRIVWSGGTTTEGGSSGSPLYDAQGRIIGQLHGGYAACGNTQPDWYGRLGVSWTGGGSAATRLSNWLDPLGLNVDAIDGYDPFGELVEDVTNFEATPLNANAIQLDWELNEDLQPVLLAFNTENTFGVPNGNYYVGQQITGGGQVIFIGDDQLYVHQPLSEASTYYYKIWSQSSTGKFSEGVTTQATTPCPAIDMLPLTEGFEENAIPVCWLQEFVEGELEWQTAEGNGEGTPNEAYQGSYNALIKADSPDDYGKVTRLITPVIDFADLEIGELSFFYANAANEDLQDTLRVYMRTSPEEDWVLLSSFETDQAEWTNSLIILPELTSSVQIAFEALIAGGHGLVIDQIKVNGFYDAEYPAPANLAAVVNNDVEVNLTWEAPEVEEGNPTLTGFLLYRNGAAVASINNPLQLNYTDTGLIAGTYLYVLTATYANPVGESLPSNAAEVEILPAPNQFELIISVQGNGNTNPAAGTYLFNEGSQVIIAALPANNNYFVNWLENGDEVSTEGSLTVAMDQDRSITAVFALNQYQVELSSVPESVGVLTGAGTYNHGQIANISTNQPQGYTFRHWKEGGVIFSTVPSFQALITNDRQFVAQFDINQYEITLEADPQAGGTVSGGGVFNFDTEITVTAQLAEGYDFGGWRENGQLVSSDLSYTFAVSNDRDLTARFNIKSYQVSLQITPQGSGVVSGAGIYNHGATVNASAAVYAGYQFVGWEENGVVVSTNNPYSFQITSNRSLLARLESTARTLVLAVEGLGTTYPPPGSYTHTLNSTISIAAVANTGWRFVKWEINDEVVNEAEIEITMSENVNATAFFEDVVSIQDLVNGTDIRVYPQPAKQKLYVDWNKMPGEASLELLNLSGQRLLQLKEGADVQGNVQTTLDISQLKGGVYLLRITGNGNAFVRKVVIQ